MVFDEINSALSIWDRFKKWRSSRKHSTTPLVESVATRFVRLLESHGVYRNQIPRFIGHGLTLKDVTDDATLLAALNEEILGSTCALFAVRREWLDGVETRAHLYHDFYNYPNRFLNFIEDLMKNNPNGHTQGVLIAPNEHDWRSEALLIFQETIGHVGEKPIYRYHLCNNWTFTYWKSRAYLTSCVAIAWKRNIFIHGINMSREKIKSLAFGATLLGWQGEGIWTLGHKTWDPEDMTLRPETFLDGVDPEPNNFGIKSGLKLWLELEAQGLMDCGFGTNARQAFQEELAKYSPS